MKWGKVVLVFQAVVTLIIGSVFMMQVLKLDSRDITELNVDLEGAAADGETVTVDIKQRYTLASYVLLIIGVIEILLVIRVFS